MRMTMPKQASALLALSLAGLVAGCSGMPDNRTLESVNQPVIEKTNYVFDLNTGPGGLSLPEQRRLTGWFEAMGLRYGDRVYIDDPLASGGTRAAVEAVAARFGMLVGSGAPMTQGYVNAGTARIIVVRASASVPNCPNWRNNVATNIANATSPNYGCAVNGNLAAMMADPENLVKGVSGNAGGSIPGAVKAIEVFREKPAKAGEVTATSSKGG